MASKTTCVFVIDSSLVTKMQMVFETLVYSPFSHLTPLLALEYFIEFSRRETFKLHIHQKSFSRPRSVSESSYRMKTRQAMYILRYHLAHSCKHCCSGKAVSIINSEYVSVAFGTQHEMRIRHIVICGLFGSTKFLHVM